MVSQHIPALSAFDAFPSKLRWWLLNALIVLLNLVGDLSYSLLRIDCSFMGQACLVATAEAFWLYAILLGLVIVWHITDLVSQRPQGRFLQITVTPVSFSVLLISLVSSLWLFRATTTIDYNGFFQTPLPVTALTFALILLFPMLVLTRALWAGYCAAKAGVELWRRSKFSKQ